MAADIDTANWSVTGDFSFFAIRRIGRTVSLTGRFRPSDTAVGTARSTANTRVYVLPAGFRSTYDGGKTPIALNTAAVAFLWQWAADDGSKYVRYSGGSSGNWADSDRVAFEASWVTDEAWPETLPGTAA